MSHYVEALTASLSALFQERLLSSSRKIFDRSFICTASSNSPFLNARNLPKNHCITTVLNTQGTRSNYGWGTRIFLEGIYPSCSSTPKLGHPGGHLLDLLIPLGSNGCSLPSERTSCLGFETGLQYGPWLSLLASFNANGFLELP